MKSEKSGNNRKDRKETRGRKPLPVKSTQVSWRIPAEIYAILEERQHEIKKSTGCEVPLSKVFQAIVKNSLN